MRKLGSMEIPIYQPPKGYIAIIVDPYTTEHIDILNDEGGCLHTYFDIDRIQNILKSGWELATGYEFCQSPIIFQKKIGD